MVTPFAVILTLLNALAAGFIPEAAYRYAVWKSEKRGKLLPEREKRPIGSVIAVVLVAGFTLLAAMNQPAWKALFTAFFALIAYFGASVDGMIRIIGNEMVLGLLGLGIIYRLALGGWQALLSSLEALGIVTLLFIGAGIVTKLLTGSRGVGMGDLKLAMAGAFIAGLDNIVLFIVGMCGMMVFCILIKYRMHTLRRGAAFPMCLSLMIGLLFSVSDEFIGPVLTGVMDALY